MSDSGLEYQPPALFTQGDPTPALMLTRVVDYAAMRKANPAKAILDLQRHHRTMLEQFARYGGNVHQAEGELSLVEFTVPLHALRCALSVQAALAQAMGAELQVRIALHCIDAQSPSRLQDGAALLNRIEPLADPSGLIASPTFQVALGQREIPFVSLGPAPGGNPSEPLEVFAWPPRAGAPFAREPAFGPPPLPVTEVEAIPEAFPSLLLPSPFDPVAPTERPPSMELPAVQLAAAQRRPELSADLRGSTFDVSGPGLILPSEPPRRTERAPDLHEVNDDWVPPAQPKFSTAMLGALGVAGSLIVGVPVLWLVTRKPQPVAPQTVVVVPAPAPVAVVPPPPPQPAMTPPLVAAPTPPAPVVVAPIAPVAPPPPAVVAPPPAPPPPDEIASVVGPAREHLEAKHLKPKTKAKLGAKLDKLEAKARAAKSPKARKKALAALGAFVQKSHL